MELLVVFLVIIGVAGLVKRKIKISKKRELSGTPVVFLSIFYILTAVVFYLFFKEEILILTVFIGIVTLLIIIFAKDNNAPKKIKIITRTAIIILFAGVTAYYSALVINHITKVLIKACPDHWIYRKIGAFKEEYLIINGKRMEITDYDTDWISKNCTINKPEHVL